MSNTKKNYYSPRRPCGGTLGAAPAENCWPWKQVNVGRCILFHHSATANSFVLFLHPPLNCTSLRCSTFKQRPKDLTFALKSKEKKLITKWTAARWKEFKVVVFQQRREYLCWRNALLLNIIPTLRATISTLLAETTIRKFKQTAPSSKQLSCFRHKYTGHTYIHICV